MSLSIFVGLPAGVERDPVRNYGMTVAAQEAEEERSRLRLEPLGCCTGLYWMQAVVALCTELPLRVIYHSCCLCGASSCVTPLSFACACAELVACSLATIAHHNSMLELYDSLAALLIESALSPCEPHSFWVPEVTLIRPVPPPEPASADCCGVCCGGFNCACCDESERVKVHALRTLRSLLCLLGGVEACHPAMVCGPCGAWESQEQRLGRWNKEYTVAKLDRTRKFYSRAETEPQRYAFFEDARTGRITVAVKGKSMQKRWRGDPPVALEMERPEGALDDKGAPGGGGAVVVQGLRPLQTRFSTPEPFRVPAAGIVFPVDAILPPIWCPAPSLLGPRVDFL